MRQTGFSMQLGPFRSLARLRAPQQKEPDNIVGNHGRAGQQQEGQATGEIRFLPRRPVNGIDRVSIEFISKHVGLFFAKALMSKWEDFNRS